MATYRPADDIDQLEKDLVEALQNAADASMPVVVPTSHQHKDNWYYCPEIKELNARMNRVCKIFRRNPTEENYELLKEVATHVSAETDTIRHDKWLEWCASLKGLVVVFGGGFCRTVWGTCLSWICRDYFFPLFFPLAAKLIGPKMGCQFFTNVDFFDHPPLNAMAYLMPWLT